MSIPFVPDDFEVPLELVTDRFRLELLGPAHNERAQAWPFQHPSYEPRR